MSNTAERYMCLGVMMVQGELEKKKPKRHHQAKRSARHKFTEEEDKLIKKHYMTKNPEFLERLLNLSWDVIRYHANRSLGLTRKPTQKENKNGINQ